MRASRAGAHGREPPRGSGAGRARPSLTAPKSTNTPRGPTSCARRAAGRRIRCTDALDRFHLRICSAWPATDRKAPSVQDPTPPNPQQAAGPPQIRSRCTQWAPHDCAARLPLPLPLSLSRSPSRSRAARSPAPPRPPRRRPAFVTVPSQRSPTLGARRQERRVCAARARAVQEQGAMRSLDVLSKARETRAPPRKIDPRGRPHEGAEPERISISTSRHPGGEVARPAARATVSTCASPGEGFEVQRSDVRARSERRTGHRDVILIATIAILY